jgi:transposase InsO family protein
MQPDFRVSLNLLTLTLLDNLQLSRRALDVIHDRDGKFCPAFRDTIEAVGVKTVKLPARSLNLNAFAKRWVKLVKDECLSKLILFGEKSLRLALNHYVSHHHHERNHQSINTLRPLDCS